MERTLLTANGADNPYTSIIGNLAIQHGKDRSEVLMDAYTDDFTQLSEGFIALCLLEAGFSYSLKIRIFSMRISLLSYYLVIPR